MSKTLIFHNPGEIDIRGAAIAGLSAKSDSTAIGYFGTGLKYAIASILRWNGQITIYSGTQRYDFICDKLNFRGREFSQVIMRRHEDGDGYDTPLGFTTEYGKDWQPWQVFRELYANALDEGGGVELVNGQNFTNGNGDETAILVTGVDELYSAWLQRDDIILPKDKHWQQETEQLQFSPSPAGHLYFKNVRVHDIKTRHTWNFKTDMKLTEDRTLKEPYQAHNLIRRFIHRDCTDTGVVEYMLREKYQGQGLSLERAAMGWWEPSDVQPSDTMMLTAARLYRQEPVVFKPLRQLAIQHDASLVTVGAYTMSRREEAMLARAKFLVGKFGLQREIDCNTIEVIDLGPSVLGKFEAGVISLSPELFNQGTKQLVATLYEECFHAKTAAQDLTYNMQSQLFNIIISLNEELHGEIC